MISLTTPKIIIAVLLFLAVLDMPYGYYTFLRLVVFISSSFFVYQNYKSEKMFWVWSFVLIALLFNPVFPIYLDKTLWVVLDILTGIFMLVSIKYSINIMRKTNQH